MATEINESKEIGRDNPKLSDEARKQIDDADTVRGNIMIKSKRSSERIERPMTVFFEFGSFWFAIEEDGVFVGYMLDDGKLVKGDFDSPWVEMWDWSV